MRLSLFVPCDVVSLLQNLMQVREIGFFFIFSVRRQGGGKQLRILQESARQKRVHAISDGSILQTHFLQPFDKIGTSILRISSFKLQDAKDRAIANTVVLGVERENIVMAGDLLLLRLCCLQLRGASEAKYRG